MSDKSDILPDLSISTNTSTETTTQYPTTTLSTTNESITSPILPNLNKIESTEQSNTSIVSKIIPEKTSNLIKNSYNNLMDTNKSFIRKIFDNTRLNPYQCKPDGLLCDPVIIYIILMTVTLVFLYIFRYQLKSKLRIGLDWILISIIFTSGLLILTNLCLYKKPSKYSIPIIIIALFALYFIMV